MTDPNSRTVIELNAEEAHFQALKQALDNSSDKNRNVLIAFLLLQLYVLITVSSTNHLQLLLPGSLVTMPLLGIDVPLLGVYLLAPLLLLAFHDNVLFNFVERMRVLQPWWHHPHFQRVQHIHLLHAFMLNIRSKYRPALGERAPLSFH